jgi:hypothetical protein
MEKEKLPEVLELNESEVRALVNLLYSIGYISHEHHPLVFEVSKKLEEFNNARQD